MFINRVNELKWLEESYKKASKEGQLLIIYGKRRVGKTELVKHFIKNKPHIYHVVEKGTAIDQLKTAAQVLTPPANFQNWREMFKFLGDKLTGQKKPLVLVFDEFPYLVESDAAVPSYFQVGWDEYLKDKKVMVVLMGSSIAMMYKHALIKSSPLYGRRTGQWLLEPFSFAETKKFYPGASFENNLSLFAITGGIPAYARVFDGGKNLRENIANFILPQGSFLSVEPELLLADEFTDPRSFLTILKSIGLGKTKFSEIIQDTGIEATALPGYLKTLINLRLISKEVPVTEPIPEKSKKGNYALADPFLRFYFSFIFPNNSLIKNGEFEALFARRGEVLTNLVAKSYEETAGEFVKQAMRDGKVPHFNQLGRWWERDAEIDLVGLNKEQNEILFTEVKWSNKPIGTEVLNELKAKAPKVVWGDKNRREYFALVSKGGFNPKLIEVAKNEGVYLFEEDHATEC